VGDPLRPYRERHDPDVTADAPGAALAPEDRPIFVVQQHDASSMHFDVRIEVDGVLASWAVPKGPSTDPRDRRLAVRTEDHALSYADFEGTIDAGEYGAGRVIVWDIGPYVNLTTDDEGHEVPVADALADGHLTVWLAGDKLRGGYAFIHTPIRGDQRKWLLIKVDDEAADARRNPVRTEPASVLTGRRVDELDDPRDGG
jgi:DNA ligase D-like protein (predicted 3'-phosphoesterase)